MVPVIWACGNLARHAIRSIRRGDRGPKEKPDGANPAGERVGRRRCNTGVAPDGCGGGGSGIVTRSTAAARFVRRYCSSFVPNAPIRLWVTSSPMSAVPMSRVPLTPKVPIAEVG